MNPPSLQDPDVTPQGTPEPEEPEEPEATAQEADGHMVVTG